MDLFVARQPIVDLNNSVAGYELLYRESRESHAAEGADSNEMSVDVVVHAFLDIGLDRITHGRPAYLNFSREMLLNDSFQLLDPQDVVIELLETVEVDEPIAEACARLQQAGYRLALDDFTGEKGHAALIDHADIIKVDVLNMSREEICDAAERIRRRGPRLLAERVESADVHEICRECGFELFQGYLFSRPQIVGAEGLGTDQLAILRIMNLLYEEEPSEEGLEKAFQKDRGLSERLLRMVNSASSPGEQVESLGAAVHIVGRESLLRWLALLLASSLSAHGEMDREMMHGAILRARFCEQLGDRHALGGPLFTLGLFSRMDVLLRTPMDDILEKVLLPSTVKEALLEGTGPYAGLLELVEAYERGDWEAVRRSSDTLGIRSGEIPGIYLEALSWAKEQMAFLTAER